MPTSPLTLSISKTSNVPILLGNTASFILTIQNVSPTQRLYNLSIYVTLPDGMSFSSATLPQTSSLTNADGSSLTSWINLKDLAPLEAPYSFTLTVRANTTFKNGSAIPFGYIFSGISIKCQVDTLPRGNDDVGNQQISQIVPMTFKSIRYYGTVTTSGKVLKGAGTASNLMNYTKVYTATYNFFNNALGTSTINVTILLPDGIRYLANISVSGTNGALFTNPAISTVVLNGITYTKLFYSGVTLSLNSSTVLNFKYAVWNRYQNNLGSLIAHGTSFILSFTMSDLTDSIEFETSFVAMDIIISTTNNDLLCDVQDLIDYTYTYEVGQYYDVQNIVVDYQLPDGIYYLSSSITPVSAVDNPLTQGFELTYQFPLAISNEVNTVTIHARVDAYYRYKQDSSQNFLPVVSFDSFTALAALSGTLIGLGTVVSDSASTSSSIKIATILKEFVQGFYQDGTPKSITTLAPLDLAQYRLIYDAATLQAIQKQVYIDDFFPLSAGPIDNLSYSFTGYLPPSTLPLPISPYGQDFYYGDIPGESFSTILFKVPIMTMGSSGQNNNLMKLSGINTLGIAYSNRMQVLMNIGSPNLSLTKSVSGPNKTAIKAGEVYTYTVTISNPNTLQTETDAFSFDVTDTLSTWFTLNQASIQVTGTGSYLTPIVVNNTIKWSINKLSPGASLTMTYNVTISNQIAPGVSITTPVTNTNPYSQLYNAALTTYQYSNQNKTASVTISSTGISLTKTSNTDLFKVGSPILYTLTLIVPQGTIAYEVSVKDILPSGSQIYLGPATRNGIALTPTITSNVISFPSEGTLNALLATQTITYTFMAQITSSTKTVGTLTSTQTNTGQVLYKQSVGGSTITVNRNLVVTINHPNIVLTLSGTDRTTSIYSTQSATINLNSVMDFKLLFTNNSLVKLVNGTIEIPINTHFNFISINTNVQCSATYDMLNKKIVMTIPSLDPNASGFLSFTVSPLSNLRSGTSIPIQATAISYYNNVSLTQVYGGEKSNLFTCNLIPGTSLLPSPSDKLNDSTSYRLTQPGGIVLITNYFQNTGGGYDDYILTIQPLGLPYTLAINNEVIAAIPSDTLYQASLPILTSVAPNQIYPITMTTTLPLDTPLGTRYDFTVNAKSVTSPYPEKTVLNIDPNA